MTEFTERSAIMFIRGKALTSPRGISSERGFTLVEILIVVVILGILASIVIPQFSSASHQARSR